MADIGNSIDPLEYENAIVFLRKKLSHRDVNTMKCKMKSHPERIREQELGIGIHIHNLLREGGFEWGDAMLYQEWKNLIDDVVHYGNR
jgi:hypothetical protein